MTAGDARARARDQEARRLAQTVFDRPVVLEAGAGTGKTAALVARIVAWCLGPGWERAATDQESRPEEIAARVLDGVVAITFTEEAAAEMARRVAEALDQLVPDDPTDPGEGVREIPGLLPSALPQDPETVALRAEALLTGLERLRVSTIHAFARTLIARFPIEAGFNPTFEIDAGEDRVAELVEQAVEEALGCAYRRPPDNERTVDALLLASRGLGPATLREAALAMVRTGLPAAALAEDMFAQDRLAPVFDALCRRLDALAPSVDALARGCSGVTSTIRAVELVRQVAGVVEDCSGVSPLEQLCRIRDEVRAGQHWRDALKKMKEWSRGRFLKSEEKALVAVDSGTTAAAQNLTQVLDWVLKLDTGLFDALRRTLAHVVEKVETEKLRRGIAVFQDLLVGGRRLLADHGHVLRVIRGEMTQLLVDEMQDTDAEQAEIVRLLVGLGESNGECPCLFLVGDPKQSIFGWRSADMAVYQGLVREVRAAGGEVRSLTVNFRSVQAVLDEVEGLVDPVMDEEEGVQPPFEPLQAGVLDVGPELLDGRRVVEHWLAADAGASGTPDSTSAADAAVLSADAVANDAAELWRAGVSPNQMAILLRSRTYQDAYLEALRVHGVPYVVGKDQSYYRMREVGEIMALVRLVLDPFDALALAAVLRSPIVAVPDVALRPLWAAGLPGLSIELNADSGKQAVCVAIEAAAAEVTRLDLREVSMAGLVAWPEVLFSFFEDLAALRRSFVEDAPDVFLEKLRLKTLVEPMAAGRFPGRYRLANLDRFFRDLEQLLAGGATAAVILRRLRRLERERPDEVSGQPRSDEQGVRVLTIHGAKGLGFRHVWLVQTHSGAQGHRGERYTADCAGDRWEVVLHGMASPGYLELERRHKRVEEAERVRLLYVALTRARQRVVTVGNWQPKKAPEGSIRQLLEGRDGGWVSARSGWPDTTVGPGFDRSGARWLWLGHPSLRGAADRTEPGKPPRIGFTENGLASEIGCHPERPVEDPSDNAGRHNSPMNQGIFVEDSSERHLMDTVSHLEIPAVSTSGVDPARVETDVRQLEDWQAEAMHRQACPWLLRASQEGHAQLRESIAAHLDDDEEEPVARRGAAIERRRSMAVGTAVHAMLERFDLGVADPDAELEAQRTDAARWLLSFLGAGEHVQGGEKLFDELVGRFRRGPLWHAFLALKGHIVARELPLIATPAPEGAVGAVTGAIDLVYRDPATNELVVADFKTDRVENEPQIEERTAAYAGQLATYGSAVETAFRLADSPRRELWFLYAGRVVVVRPR